MRDAGFTVWMPHLFGVDGKPLSIAYGLASMIRGCISREFRAFAANASSPVIDWLRALAAHAHPLCGGKRRRRDRHVLHRQLRALVDARARRARAGAVRNRRCRSSNHGGMHIAPDELAEVKERMEREDLTVLAYRFAGDSFCRAERFAAYQEALGDRFVRTVLPDRVRATRTRR